MRIFKKNYFLLIFLVSNLVFAQIPINNVSGIILDEKNLPIEFALIKIDNSTIFAETDTLGRFTLHIPENVFKITLIISRIGFETNSIEVKPNINNLRINLKSTTTLNEITTTAQRTAYWKRKLKIFEDILLGESPYRKSCKILNENDIIIHVLENQSIEITLKHDLRILNGDLGYILELRFNKLTIQEGSYSLSLNDILGYGYCFFYEQKAKNSNEEKRWKKNRDAAFDDSLRGFLATLIYKKGIKNYDAYQQRTIIKNGYYYSYNSKLIKEIEEERLVKIDLDTLASFDSVSKKYKINSKLPFLVFSMKSYNYQNVFSDSRNEFSYIGLPNDNLIFDKYGYTNSLYALGGFWAKAKYSSMLPQDFLPKKYLE